MSIKTQPAEIESVIQRKNKHSIKDWSTIIAFAVIVIILAVASPHFLTVNNITNILLQSSNIMLLAVGLTFIFICGQIDLSLGSIEALAGSFIAVAMVEMNMPLPIAIIMGVLSGMACGVVSGTLIAYFKFPPFIATLSMQCIARGVGLIITKGAAVAGFSDAFKFIGQGKVWIIPFPIILFMIIMLLGNLVLKHTKFGANLYAVGSNEHAASLSGINVKRMKVAVLTISGSMAALAGIVMTSRLSSGQATIGEYDVMDTIAAVVIGGTSMRGGVGKMRGTFIGVVMICTIRNGLNLLGVSAYWQMVAIGIIITIAILIDLISKGELKK